MLGHEHPGVHRLAAHPSREVRGGLLQVGARRQPRPRAAVTRMPHQVPQGPLAVDHVRPRRQGAARLRVVPGVAGPRVHSDLVAAGAQLADQPVRELQVVAGHDDTPRLPPHAQGRPGCVGPVARHGVRRADQVEAGGPAAIGELGRGDVGVRRTDDGPAGGGREPGQGRLAPGGVGDQHGVREPQRGGQAPGGGGAIRGHRARGDQHARSPPARGSAHGPRERALTAGDREHHRVQGVSARSPGAAVQQSGRGVGLPGPRCELPHGHQEHARRVGGPGSQGGPRVQGGAGAVHQRPVQRGRGR